MSIIWKIIIVVIAALATFAAVKTAVDMYRWGKLAEGKSPTKGFEPYGDKKAA